MILELDANNFEAVVLDSDQPQVVWFTAKWCGPCKALGPQIVGASVSGHFNLIKADVDEISPDILSTYNVKGVPTVLVFQNGAVVGEVKSRHRNGILEELVALGV